MHYYMRLKLELLMVSVSGYVECVKLHHIWKGQPQAGVYQLYTTLCSAISVIYGTLIFTSSVVHIYIYIYKELCVGIYTQVLYIA